MRAWSEIVLIVLMFVTGFVWGWAARHTYDSRKEDGR
jgi:hypothetical protein